MGADGLTLSFGPEKLGENPFDFLVFHAEHFDQAQGFRGLSFPLSTALLRFLVHVPI